MTDELPFEIIPDSERPSETRGRGPSPLLEALRAGKTLFLAGRDRGSMQGYYSYFRRQPGWRFRVRKDSRNGITGVTCWIDKDETTT